MVSGDLCGDLCFVVHVTHHIGPTSSVTSCLAIPDPIGPTCPQAAPGCFCLRNSISPMKSQHGHLGGLMCTDWTTFGSQRRMTGPTAPLTIMWIRLRQILRESWLLATRHYINCTNFRPCSSVHTNQLTTIDHATPSAFETWYPATTNSDVLVMCHATPNFIPCVDTL